VTRINSSEHGCCLGKKGAEIIFVETGPTLLLHRPPPVGGLKTFRGDLRSGHLGKEDRSVLGLVSLAWAVLS
jgi:hypothetical protein